MSTSRGGRRPGGRRPLPDEPSSPADVERFVDEVALDPYNRATVERLRKCAEECEDNEEIWSLSKNGQVGPDGHWMLPPARQKLHQRIVKKLLKRGGKAVAPARPCAILLFGGPGSGKTTATKYILGLPEFTGLAFAVINSDDAKEALPEYRGWNAALVHAESQMIVYDQALPLAVAERRHIVLDMVGGNFGRVAAIVSALTAKGSPVEYDVYVVYVDLPLHKAVYRVWRRFADVPLTVDYDEMSGRFVALPVVVDVGDAPRKTFEQLKGASGVKGAFHVDTDLPKGKAPRIRRV